MHGDEPAGTHPLDARLRVLEGHVEELLDVLALVERRAEKHEMEIQALTGKLCEIAGGISDMMSARLQRDRDREEDRAILRRLVLYSLALAACMVVAAYVVAWLGSSRAISLDFRGLIPPYHSSELPREAGGKAL